jgi:hypothetical protein
MGRTDTHLKAVRGYATRALAGLARLAGRRLPERVAA